MNPAAQAGETAGPTLGAKESKQARGLAATRLKLMPIGG
jgi:hypothetical protein